MFYNLYTNALSPLPNIEVDIKHVKIIVGRLIQYVKHTGLVMILFKKKLVALFY